MGKKVMARNRKARHLYTIEDTIEAGIVLKGPEVKSIRNGGVNIADSYAHIRDGEAFIINMHVSPYEQGNIQNVDPVRSRKLLLHKNEIRNLEQEVRLRGNTLVPLRLYFRRGKLKVLLGVGKGKKVHDRRRDIAKRDADRRMRQHASEKYTI